MTTKAPTKLMTFLIEDEDKEKLLTIGAKYGTGNKSAVLRKLINREYETLIMNPQVNQKEGN